MPGWLLDMVVVAKADDGTLERMAVEDFGSAAVWTPLPRPVVFFSATDS